MLLIVALCIVSGAAGAYLALALATADLANWGLWARDFAKSPGAAAFAALIAAAIAFAGISRQVSVSRSALEHQREAASTARWWETFEWASSRALPIGEKDLPLPDSVTISTLQSLSQTTATDVQKVACAGVIDVLTSRLVSMSNESEDADEVAEPGASAAFDALASYVQASDGTSAASPRAEAAVYERTVLQALKSLSTDIRVFREPRAGDTRTDAVVELGDAKVAVEVTFARTPLVVRARARSAAQQRRHNGAIPVVLVSRFSSPFTPDEEAELRVVVAQWNTPEDNETLLGALRRASTL
ncbi:hypothetical protein QE367_000386 [Microbacterium paludicola]|uniref:Restriction endonuclease type IV Mrr domain-containing protein n=1 Tax=Microbacterium paludicola TaxID=300019 RepID=A0ABU1HY29_9MICO|nr:hypothetical protein [Microbacterium paludicola]MDR6166182.1 hypothetical protein [Microbacterium paludicola]